MANFDLIRWDPSDIHTIESSCASLAELIQELKDKKFLVGKFVTWSGRKLPEPVEFAVDVASIRRIVKSR